MRGLRSDSLAANKLLMAIRGGNGNGNGSGGGNGKGDGNGE